MSRLLFPVSLPGPFSSLKGGVVTGLITLVAVIGVLLPCNLVMAVYMKWLIRDTEAQYDRIAEEKGLPKWKG